MTCTYCDGDGFAANYAESCPRCGGSGKEPTVKQKKYGVCDCGNWGEAPASFRESKHFLKCTCSKAMYLGIFDPREAGHRLDRKIEVGTMEHGEDLR